MSATINAALESRQKDIIAEFADLSDWQQRYRKLIELGKELASLPEDLKTDESLVKGCQSRVWMHAHLESGRMQIEADSDALIVKGLVALLLRVYSGAKPEEVLATPPVFIEALGLTSHLSPSRANGLHSMLKQIKYFAMAFQAMASMGS